MDYKKIFKNKKLRFKILSLLRFIPDKTMLKIQYWVKHNRRLDLKNPKRFTEKIQWYKLNYKNNLMPICSDKFLVRQYVKDKGLGDILNEMYCVFEKPQDICFNKLPDKFVLKLSNGSGTNVFCRDKSLLELDSIKQKFFEFMLAVKSDAGREWPYIKSKSVIVAERLLQESDDDTRLPSDYKIFCFNGKPEYIICISDRYTDKCNHLVYDTNWNKVHVVSEGARIDEDAPKPGNLNEMLEIASKLSEDFPFARVDLYSINSKIYFGEITFFPWSGYMEFEPDEFDFILGEKFKLL